MSTFNCCLCFYPADEPPHEFKTVLINLVQFFNTFQSYRMNCITLDKLMLCTSCWIYFLRLRQFDVAKRLKTEICDAEKALLSSKIRRAQRSQMESVNPTSCKDSQVQILATTHNDDSDSNVGGQSLNSDGAESISYPLNNTDASNDNSLKSCETAKVNTTDSAPASATLAATEPKEVTSHDTSESDSESQPPKAKTIIDNVPTSASSPEKELAEATSTNTSDSESDWEPAKRKKLVSASASASSKEKEPAELTSDDTSDSDSEPEPTKAHQAAIPAQDTRDPKNLTCPKSLLDVKRLSEEDFTYMGKYPFAVTDAGFKCGLCSSISSANKDRSPWYNMIKHIQAWHIGNHKIRARKVTKRFIEIAPNRFQYGEYKVELIDGKYRCEECGEFRACKRGSKAANMMEHINSRHENSGKTYVCELCGKVYRNSFGFSEHMKTKHQNPDGQFPCSECGKTFASRFRTSLHHKQVHGIKKKFVCEICGKECSVKANLENHIAFVHNGRRFECNECDKVFGSKFSLNIHRHCHLGTKFTCDICGMEFSQQGHVKRHKKTAHPQSKSE